jgi:hypothetical protein
MPPIVILYEDAAVRGGQVKDYGPHLLVRQCVADRLGKQLWELRQLDANPRNGASNIRLDCKQNPPAIGRAGGRVFAVYDFDQIHQEVKLSSSACKEQLKEVLKKECAWQDRLTIVFLERNIETVVEAVCSCASGRIPEDQRLKAIKHKRLNARDLILKRVLGPSDRALREAVLHEVPSFAYLVDKVVAALEDAGS